MWLIQDCFRCLEDVELVLPACGEGMVSKGWWVCVEDAFREGMGYRVVEWELFDGIVGGSFRERFPRLKLVDDEGVVVCWSEYGGKGKSNDSGCLL